MNTFTSEKFSRMGMRTAALALVLSSAVAISGCSSGGSSTNGSTPQFVGVLQPDLHGDIPLNATRLLPDNGSVMAAINEPGDVDWFKYEAVANVTYVLQVSGFDVQTPNIQTLLNTTGTYELFVRIFFSNASLHYPNTTGVGDMYDDLPTGFQAPPDLEIEDNRIIWVPQITGTYFIRIEHGRDPLGTGNYHVNLATSQFGQTIPIERRNWRAVEIPGDPTNDNDPPFIINRFVQGGTFFEFDVSNNTFSIGRFAEPVFRVMLIDDVYQFVDDPDTQALHIHFGVPNPADSLRDSNFTDGPGPHNIAIDIPLGGRSADLLAERAGSVVDESSFTVAEILWPGQDGEEVRLPALITTSEAVIDGSPQEFTQVQIDAERVATRQTTVNNSDQRLIFGFPWYVDSHYTTDFNMDPVAVASSGNMGDAYTLLEAELLASPLNLTREQQAKIPAGYYDTVGAVFESSFELLGAARQAHSDGLIRYDAALQAFILNDRLLDNGFRPSPAIPFFIPPGSGPPVSTLNLPPAIPPTLSGEIPPEYVGKRIDVHKGGIGQNGALIIALGTIPAPELPPGVLGPVAYTNQVQSPIFSAGFPSNAQYDNEFDGSYISAYQDKTIIKKLTNAEVRALRKAFYSGGFHILIKDQKNGNVPISRAEGFIGINLTPNDPGGGNFKDGGYHSNTGTVRFVSQARGLGAITVIANGEIIGDITQSVSEDEIPECGNDTPGAVVSAELLPDDYAYRAFTEDGTEWEGLFTVEGNGSCNTVVLAP